MAQALKFGKGVWATKTGSSMAYSDTNDRYKPLPFNVERDSIATRVNKEGLIEVVGHDKLRIDYTDTDKGVALLENTSTNLLPYSEDFSNSAWGKTNVTLTSNNVISPDGTQNASKLEATGADGNLQDSITVTSGTTYTFSVYLKTVSGTLDIAISLGSPGFPQNEGEGGRYKNITVTNEWKRYTLTSTADASAATGIGVGGFNSFSTGEEVYVWGAMLEANSIASSYIPTSGSAVQRAADVANNAGNSEVFNDSEGVLFANISQDNDSFNTISISDGGTSDRVTMVYQNNTIKSILVHNNNVVQLEKSGYLQNLFHKVAIKYTSSNVSLIINGFELLTASRGAFADSLNTLQFAQGNGGNNFYGKTKEISYYDAVLTDSELEYLTSYRSLSELVKELNLNTL